jgi:hypothetical protein
MDTTPLFGGDEDSWSAGECARVPDQCRAAPPGDVFACVGKDGHDASEQKKIPRVAPILASIFVNDGVVGD